MEQVQVQRIIETLADRLHRAVAVDDPRLQLVAHTAHSGEVDRHRIDSIMNRRVGPELMEYSFGFGILDATKPVRIPRHPGLNAMARYCISIRSQGTLLGFLWLIDDDDTLTEADVEAATQAADMLGDVMLREQLIADVRRRREHELILDILHTNERSINHLGDDALHAKNVDPRQSTRVIVISAPPSSEEPDSEERELLVESVIRRCVRKISRAESLVATRRGGHAYVLVMHRELDDPTTAVMHAAREIRTELGETVPHAGRILIGIGSRAAAVADSALSYRRALQALEVARQVRSFGDVAPWDELGVYRFLSTLPTDRMDASAVPDGLRALIDAEGGPWLFDTLDVFLEAAGNVQESARQLHIHRATLYYRLTRIEELTGMSLADGGDRLALHLGIKLVTLLGEHPGRSSGASLN